jgi:hypothetical protein
MFISKGSEFGKLQLKLTSFWILPTVWYCKKNTALRKLGLFPSLITKSAISVIGPVTDSISLTDPPEYAPYQRKETSSFLNVLFFL